MTRHLLAGVGSRGAVSAPVRAWQRLALIGQLIRYGEGRSATTLGRRR